MIDLIGGSGFIGTRICELLEAAGRRDFRIVDKRMSRHFPDHASVGDVRSLEDLRKTIRPGGTLVNLAAEHRDDVRPFSLYEEVNVRGAENICIVASDRAITRIVFTSSVAVYGETFVETSEAGAIAPVNEYGRTKFLAEQVFVRWQNECPAERALIIVRPTVVFGERNRGNVYNLFNQIASNRFMMIGDGKNKKSVAYVDNVAAFLLHAMEFAPGVHLYNYVDKPDYSMNELVSTVYQILGKRARGLLHLPYSLGYAGGRALDALAVLTKRRFPVSGIRVRKFCANSVFSTAVRNTGFMPLVSLEDALRRTIGHEFRHSQRDDRVFYSE